MSEDTVVGVEKIHFNFENERARLVERLVKGETTIAALQTIVDNPEEHDIRRKAAAAAIDKFRAALNAL